MKVYKLSEQALKKRKTENTICGVGYLILSILQFCSYGIEQDSSIVSVSMFVMGAVLSFFASYKLDQCYIELNGKVLTAYMRGKIFAQSDLNQAEIVIKEHKRNSKIKIIEYGKPLVVHKARFVGNEAFNEMIKDINFVMQQ